MINMKPETVTREKRIVFMIGTVALAVAAGVAGAAMVANYMIGSISVPVNTTIVPKRPTAKSDATKVSAASRSAVTFYKKRSGVTLLEKLPLPTDAVGSGMVLTADGWLVTATSVLAGNGPLIAVFADRTAVAVDPIKAVNDAATGVAYLKTDAQHLTVAVFGDDAVLQGADPVFSVGVDSIIASTVLAPRQLPVASRADYVESTERLARRIVMGKSGLAGSAVVDGNGQVVGLDQGDGTAVPETFVIGILRDLFKDGKISRPRAGFHFVSLDILPDAKSVGLAESGALVVGDGKTRAVSQGSAAEAAGLREADVITSVERDRINNEETLSERLQDYAAGAKVELTVERDGKQIKVPLTLQ